MTKWLRRLVSGQQLERHLDAELRDHVERQAADFMRAGLPEAEARRQATLTLGGFEQTKEHCREARGTLWVEQILRDVRYALRQMQRQPVFWSIVVLTLVVGVSTSTTIFAVVNGILLQPLPYRDASRLVSLRGLGYRGEFLQMRERGQTMDVGAYMERAPASLTGVGEPQRLQVALANAEFFDILGTDPQIGRRFSVDDTSPGAPPVVVLGHGAWQRLGGEPDIIGRTLTLDGVAHTVIGVMPRAFRLPASAQLWLPLIINPADRIDLWANSTVIVGRLREGRTLEQARDELRALIPSFRPLFPWRMPEDYGRNATALPLREQIVGDIRPTLLVLLAAVATVLLTLIVNVANLLLTRGFSRTRELAIRTAIGATRARLVRQLLIESLTVALIACGLGIAAAFFLLDVAVAFIPPGVPRADEIALNGNVLAFALGVSLLAGVLFGVLPAATVSKVARGSALRLAGVSRVQASERRTSRVLAIAQLALAVILVVSAVLLVGSLRNLLAVDPGFRAEQLVTANVAPPRVRYGRPDAFARFVDELLGRLRGMPGVQAAAAGSAIPFGGRLFGGVFSIEGRPDPATQSGDWPLNDLRVFATEDYLRVLDVRVLDGRALDATDTASTQRVTMVSHSLARTYWGDTSPVGERIRFPGNNMPWVTIVGVVADLKWGELGEERNWASATPPPTGGWLRTLYLPMAQMSTVDNNGFRLLVRTEGDPQMLTANLRTIVAALDADTPVSDVRMSEALIEQSVARPRVTATLLALFASIALFLGAIGVYGVLSHAVGQRTQEFAVRLALGADPGELVRRVMFDGARLTAVGVGLGVIGSLGATRLLSRLLFGVEASDLSVLLGVSALIVAIGLLASSIPARRAMRVDPVIALQAE